MALIDLSILRENIELSKKNEQLLARVLISEASIGNEQERIAVGLTVINRMKKVSTNKVKDVVRVNGFNHYATNQDPSLYPEYTALAKRLLSGQIQDFTTGATHFFSPYSMPKEGESKTNFDCDGGFLSYINPESSQPVAVCTPGWSKVMRHVDLSAFGVRPYYFEFYAAQ